MGKVEQLVHSLCARMSSSKSKASKRSSPTSASPSSLSSSPTDTLHNSTSTVDTQATSSDGNQTLPTSPSITPPASIRLNTQAIASESTRGPPHDQAIGTEPALLGAYKAREVNVLMLDFAKRLPLVDLGMIGRGLGPHSPRKEPESKAFGVEAHPCVSLASSTGSRTLSLTNSSSSSSWSFACCSARQAERDNAKRESAHRGNSPSRGFEQISPARVLDEQPTHSRTLSLRSASSDSSWAFACRSARRIERDHAQQKSEVTDHGSKEDDGSLASTTVVHSSDHPHRITFCRPVRCSLPDPTPIKPPCVADGGAESGPTLAKSARQSERAPSFKRRSVDSADLCLWPIAIRIPGVSFTRMSDEEFDNLPDWSDVEDDPEHNRVEKRSCCWSTTASSRSPNSLEDIASGGKAPAPAARHAMMSDEEFEALRDWCDAEDHAEFTMASPMSSSEKSGAAPPAVYVPTGHPRPTATRRPEHATKTSEDTRRPGAEVGIPEMCRKGGRKLRIRKLLRRPHL